MSTLGRLTILVAIALASIGGSPRGAVGQMNPPTLGRQTSVFNIRIPRSADNDTAWSAFIANFVGGSEIRVRGQIVRGSDGSATSFGTVDSLRIAFDSGWVVVPGCQIGSLEAADSILGLARYQGQEEYLSTPRQAWIISGRPPRIRQRPVTDVRCPNPFVD